MSKKFFMQGRTIYQRGTVKRNEDGSQNMGMHHPICHADDCLENPDVLLNILNTYNPLLEALENGRDLMMYGLKMMEKELKANPNGEIQQENIQAAMNACVGAGAAISQARGEA